MRNCNLQIFKIFLLCSLVFTIKLHAQEIKIYVSDVETGKNVPNAKVCLEGFEIPAIKMLYDKKGKYYYANKIPVNYNTVMVYHQKYNEKGFQDIKNLPTELFFQLHKPFQNYYEFENCNDNQSAYKSIYIEDQFKIALVPKQTTNYNVAKDKIIELIKDTSLLTIELVNPYWELKKRIGQYEGKLSKKKDYFFTFQDFPNPKIYTSFEPYPFLNAKNFYGNDFFSEESKDYGKADIFPTKYGFSSDEVVYSMHKNVSNYNVTLNDIVFFIRKKNGDKFKRFNDEIINRISKSKDFDILFIVYNKAEEKPAKTSKQTTFRDLQNIKYNSFFKIDSSKMFFYNPYLPDRIKPNDGEVYLKKTYQLVGRNSLVPNTLYQSSQKQLKINDDICGKPQTNFLKYENSIGLGILDLYEYYYNQNKK